MNEKNNQNIDVSKQVFFVLRKLGKVLDFDDHHHWDNAQNITQKWEKNKHWHFGVDLLRSRGCSLRKVNYNTSGESIFNQSYVREKTWITVSASNIAASLLLISVNIPCTKIRVLVCLVKQSQ